MSISTNANSPTSEKSFWRQLEIVRSRSWPRPNQPIRTNLIEKEPLRDLLREHWFSTLCAFICNFTIIMEGYSLHLLGMYLIHDKFKEDFGHKLPQKKPDGSDEWNLTAASQIGLLQASGIGAMVGLFCSGYICDRIGYRRSFLLALGLVMALINLSVFAKTLPVLCAGQFLVGIPFGMFQSLTVAYANEVSAPPMRAIAVSNIHVAWIFGQIISDIVMVVQISHRDYWSWRLPLLVVVPLCVGILVTMYIVCPESPIWLVRKGQPDRAKNVLEYMYGRKPEKQAYIAARVADMVHTIDEERRLSANTSYSRIIRNKVSRRRLLLTCGLWCVQSLCGTALLGLSTVYFTNVGLTPTFALYLALAQYAMGILAIGLSWVLMNMATRRHVLLVGLFFALCTHGAIGLLGVCHRQDVILTWAVSGLLIFFAFVYNLTIAPVVYAILPDIPSNEHRQKSLSLARMFYLLVGLVQWNIAPLMLHKENWNMGAKAGFVFFGTCLFCMVWSYFKIPETKCWTTAAVNWLFEQKMPARGFGKAQVPESVVASDRDGDRVGGMLEG
jgi:SP family general alpha glucoside:H+ symporter-like MFS transporter